MAGEIPPAVPVPPQEPELKVTEAKENTARSSCCCSGKGFGKVALIVASVAAIALGVAIASGVITAVSLPWAAPALIGGGALGFTAGVVWLITGNAKASKAAKPEKGAKPEDDANKPEKDAKLEEGVNKPEGDLEGEQAV